MAERRQLAVVTGASPDIGYELAMFSAFNGLDLVVAADKPLIEEATADFRRFGAAMDAVKCNLSKIEGVNRVYAALNGRPVAALFANAGRGFGNDFLDLDFAWARHKVDTNVPGTIYRIHSVGNDLRARNAGKILINSSIAGFIPGSFQAV